MGEELEARLVKMVCKRASIKAGQVLSDIEMKELVRQLEECQSPRTCRINCGYRRAGGP